MSMTDHARPSKRADYGQRVPKHIARPVPRRQRTRRQAVLAAVREAS